MPRTFGEGSGNERASTLRTTSAKRVASRSIRPACQCVYQSASRTPSGFASGAARTRKSGTMCASTASGRGPAPEAPPPARGRSGRRVRAASPRRTARTRTLAGNPECAPTDAQRTTSSSERAASASTRSSVCASTGCSASSVWVTKTSRIRRSCGRSAPDRPPQTAPASSASRHSAHAPRRPAPVRAAVLEDADERGDERVLVAGRDQDSLDPVRDEVGYAAGIGGDHPAPARERLDHDAAETFGPGREDEQRRLVERTRDLVRTRAPARARPAQGDPRRAGRPPPAASRGRRSRAEPRARPGRHAAMRLRAPRCSCTPPASRRRARSAARAAPAPGSAVNAERSL